MTDATTLLALAERAPAMAAFDVGQIIGHCTKMDATALAGGQTYVAREVWQQGRDILVETANAA